MKKKIILDCDNTMGLPLKEIDDGLTILYLMGHPKINLLGITTTFGNGKLEEVLAQTNQLMQQIKQVKIPILEGESSPKDGITPAAKFLAEKTAQHPGEVSILAIGPLGNLHQAALYDPNFFKNVKEIICMGGITEPLKIGWKNLGELNLSANYDAAHTVLHSGCSITLMNAQFCLNAPFRFTDLRKLTFWGSKTRNIIRNWLMIFSVYCGIKEFYLWDLLPALHITNPELFENNFVNFLSTVEDLKNGYIFTDPSKNPSKFNMPEKMAARDKIIKTLFKYWKNIKMP